MFPSVSSIVLFALAATAAVSAAPHRNENNNNNAESYESYGQNTKSYGQGYSQTQGQSYEGESYEGESYKGEPYGHVHSVPTSAAPTTCQWTCVAVDLQSPPITLTSNRGPFYDAFKCSYGRETCYYDNSGALIENGQAGGCPTHAEGGC